MEAIALHYKPFRFNDDEFYEFCQQNSDLKLERQADGTIIIMPNTGGNTGRRNSKLNFQFQRWNMEHNLGEIFDSSTAFRLPSSAVRSGDVSFVAIDRWESLTAEEQDKFPPLCPDFIVELMSPSDTLRDAQAKIQIDWIANGCRLAWLIDPKTETAYIYRADGSIQINRTFAQPLFGEDVLPGFELDLRVLQD